MFKPFRYTLIIATLFLVADSQAQIAHLYRDTTVHVMHGAKTLRNAWTGGLNAPVFIEIDLNNDQKMDLATFDGIDDYTFRISCFLNVGQNGVDTWVNAPEYVKAFPTTLSSWLRSFDYDCDGDMDLFSYMNGGGMQYWRNEMIPSGTLQFSLVTTSLNTHYNAFSTGIYVSRVDMPALSDLDNDGDMDVLNFSNSANFLEHNRNYSMDSTGSCTSISRIHNIWKCWGYFFTLFGYSSASLPPDTSASPTCPLLPANLLSDQLQLWQRTASSSARHSGSATYATDLDGDGDKDILLTDIASSRLLYIKNCGTPDSAYACLQDSMFPSYNVPADVGIPMGSPYVFDADNDGKKDLIYANFTGSGEDYENAHYYRNISTNAVADFALTSKRFLGNTMIDVGTGSHPVFFDWSGDGLPDLFVGNDYFTKNFKSKIAYYQNTGSLTKPVFTLITDDFANASALSGVAALSPTFGDLDGDGDADMLCGEDGGGLLYFQNNAGVMTFAMANYQSIGIGANAMPQLIDVDRDSKLDLLIGKRGGTISYFRNTSTNNIPVFTLVTSNFGGVPVNVKSFSAPALVDVNGAYELLVGSEKGWIYHFTNIDGNLAGTFTLADSIFQNIEEPARISPAVADIDGDGKYDLVIGNLLGGLVCYTQNAALSAIDEGNSSPTFVLSPNPAADWIQIRLANMPTGQAYQVAVYDVLGKEVLEQELRMTTIILDVSALKSGLYLCRVRQGEATFVQPFIKE